MKLKKKYPSPYDFPPIERFYEGSLKVSNDGVVETNNQTRIDVLHQRGYRELIEAPDIAVSDDVPTYEINVEAALAANAEGEVLTVAPKRGRGRPRKVEENGDNAEQS